MPKSNGDMERAREKDFERQVHSSALARKNQERDAPETLKYVSEPEDIDSPAEALAWINSKSASTTNLSNEDVRSEEWVIQYFQLLARMNKPPHYGISGHRRAWAHGDLAAFERPLEPDDKLEFEGFAELGNLTTKKSEDGWGVETSTRDTTESIMRKDDGESKSGWFGRFRS